MPGETLVPADIERWLSTLVRQLGKVGGPDGTLARARDAEVSARHAFKAAQRRWLLSDDAPKVSRAGCTTAERDAWVGEKTAALEQAYDLAVVAREAAQDHLRTLREQAEVVRSLGASVRQAYELAGTGA